MKRKRKVVLAVGILLILVVPLGLFFSGIISHTVTLSATEIQSALQSKFPFDKKELIFTVRFSDPTVAFDDAPSNKIKLGLNVKILTAGVTLASGNGEAIGPLRYESKTGEFFLDSPSVTVHDIFLIRMGERDKPRAMKLIEQGLHEYFARMPIYRLDDKESKFVFMRRVLKSMKVQNGRLQIELGL